MSNQKGYPAIDRFRMVAAFLVVAIHTGPLLCFGTLPDYIFTHVLARVGVPFFLAASGFFVLAPYIENRRAPAVSVLRFVRKTLLLYAACVLLYLPVNLYAGHFNEIQSLGQAARMLLVDGTMYHLWYLPAAALGALVVWGLLHTFGLRVATTVAAGLYLLGLLGDSYYGLAAQVPWLASLYDGIFTVSTYTRNGLFFAPIFLLVGVWARHIAALPRQRAAIGLGISLALLLAEGLLLYGIGWQRHDSMYIALPACILFLMVWLASIPGASHRALRDTSLAVYILHPWVIVALRGMAKPLGLGPWLVDNSLLHYLTVCILSLAAGALWAWLCATLRHRRHPSAPLRAWVEVDTKSLAHNVRVLQGLLPPGCQLMPAIKANAYGLGAVPIAKKLYQLGVQHFCVATLAEGIALRRAGVRSGILVLGHTPPEGCRLLRRWCLAQTVVDAEHARQLAQTGIPLHVHVKVDTGMHRLGQLGDEADALYSCFTHKTLRVDGVFTQLGCSDSPHAEDIAYTRRQLDSFYSSLDALKARGVPVPPTHVQCSYGILNYPDIKADFARPGLALYGVVDEACCIGPAPPLVPVFQVKARIALVKSVCQGQRVGYGSAYIAPRSMRVAVITMGYADGLPRSLSGTGAGVLINGTLAPFVGSICMDQAIVDVSAIPTVYPGGIAMVVGRSGRVGISVQQLAALAGTIPNEIMSGLGPRLERQLK